MPTRNRRHFVGQSIWYFLRQDYPARELVIIDDGEDAVGDLVPDDERIRYLRLERRLPLGEKRNLACQESRGELIAHWDDDDWIAPHRLSVQVSKLLEAKADVCGARELLHYHLNNGEAWLYRYPRGERPWLAGSTLLYRRSIWAQHPFPKINTGEDTSFVWELPPERLHSIPDRSLYVALIHPHNTGAKNLADRSWERRSMHEVSQLIALDRDFYAAMRSGSAYPALNSNRPRSSSVTVSAPFMVYDGYGSMAEYLVLGMARAGARVNVMPLDLDLSGLSAEFLEILRRSKPEPGAPVLYFCWPRSDLERLQGFDELFINTMWESSQLPSGWTGHLNRARAVIVPTRFVAQVCRASGVNTPVEVIPEGIDPHIYHYVERGDRPGITTLIIGTLVNRKHTREGIAAWKLAFEGNPDARLIIKARFKYRNYSPDDPRISFVDSNEATRGILHWYQRADVLLALGNEGFGLPLIEGMATGLPVIALNSEGQADICEQAGEYLLPVSPARWEPSNDEPFGRAGVRAVPDVQGVAEKLTWVARHPEAARQMGRAASQWALQNCNVWSKGPAMLDVLERHLKPSRALRRSYTIWAPSWGSRCGIAEYTAHLTQGIPGVKASAVFPGTQGTRLLHIQHEPSLFKNSELTHFIQRMRRNRIPVVVTEHVVGHHTHAWEREADVLLSHTQRGAKILRQRWPGKQVEHIPHGCPTWFPPRKRQRGHVIAAFGFLEPHKGFWRLLDALREIPGSELLLYSYAKSSEIEARWERDARGLAVKRVKQYLPAEEVAQQIAAQADALVFWYDEAPFIATSGAVRIGLATGVPVLASPTGWFQEVRQVTYQPDNLIEGLKRLLEDSALREQLTQRSREYCHENGWPRIAERHLALWQSIESN
jgi:glycosyltransferase involved in cell wall biosynthesis